MTKFIKFAHVIINTAYINHVAIYKPAKKFIIHVNSSQNSGMFFLGTGYFCNNFNHLLVSDAEDPEGYASVEKWIQTMECVSKN
jgi:hypothetical protein